VNFITSNKSEGFAESIDRDKLKQSEQHYRLLFENNPLPAWIFDVDSLRFL
jgi:PAS domain-containing protein